MVKCFTKKKNDGSNYTACVDFNKKTKKTTKPKSKLKGRKLKIKGKVGKPTAKGVMTIQKKIKTTKKLKNKSTIKAPLTKSKVKPKKTAKPLLAKIMKMEVKSRIYAGRELDWMDQDDPLAKTMSRAKKTKAKITANINKIMGEVRKYNTITSGNYKPAFIIEKRELEDLQDFIRIKNYAKYDAYTDKMLDNSKGKKVALVRKNGQIVYI